MKKTISALVTVWNGSSYLQQTLESIAAQSFAKAQPEAFEVIIADDASTDDSLNIIRIWQAEQLFDVTVIKNAFNKGVWANLNAAYAEAEGAYIAQISHDDLWQPDFLDTLYAALHKAPTAAAAFSQVQFINAEGAAISGHHFRHESLAECDRHTLLTELVKRNLLCGSSALIRNAFFCSSFWGISNEMLQDYEAWLNLLLEGEFLYVPSTYVSYRLHQNNLSGGVVSVAQHHYERLSLLNRVFLSARFMNFYCATEDIPRLDFIHKLDAAFLSLGQRVEGIDYLHGQLLDRLQSIENTHTKQLITLRAAIALRLGMARKYHRLRCLVGLPNSTLNDVLPPLAAYGSIKKTAVPVRLMEAGIGQLVKQWSENKGFLLIAAKEWPNNDSLVLSAAQQRRLLLWGTEISAAIEEGYGFAIDAPLNNEQIMEFWRHCEKANLVNAAHLNHTSFPWWLTYARNIYRKVGGLVPLRLRNRLVYLAHRIIDKAC